MIGLFSSVAVSGTGGKIMWTGQNTLRMIKDEIPMDYHKNQKTANGAWSVFSKGLVLSCECDLIRLTDTESTMFGAVWPTASRAPCSCPWASLFHLEGLELFPPCLVFYILLIFTVSLFLCGVLNHIHIHLCACVGRPTSSKYCPGRIDTHPEGRAYLCLHVLLTADRDKIYHVKSLDSIFLGPSSAHVPFTQGKKHSVRKRINCGMFI